MATNERDEYKAGANVTDRVVRRQSPGMVVSVRLDARDARRLRHYAKDTERTVSEVSRLAIRRFLDSEESFSQYRALQIPIVDGQFTWALSASSRTYTAWAPRPELITG